MMMTVTNIQAVAGRTDQYVIDRARDLRAVWGAMVAAQYLRALGLPCVVARAILARVAA